MNAERLLAHYERIADAPDAIARLRRFILDLAVRGKLVPQNPNDEPASRLLAAVDKRFASLGASGQLNRPKPIQPIKPENFLFRLPSGWSFSRFNAIASIESNLVDPRGYKQMPHIAPDNIESWTGKLLPYSSVGEAGVFSGKHLFKPGVLLYSKIRPNLAKITKADFEGLCSADMYPIFPLISRDYLLIFMITKYFVDQAVSEDNRVAMPKINQAALSKVVVAVPPLAEQHRIVAKVDELMALCDQLEAARAEREVTRDRLAAMSLARLNAPDPETFQADARFALDALPTLTTRPDQIKELRQTILNLAVRGRLGGNIKGDFRPVDSYRSLQNGYAFKSEWFTKQGTRLLRNANIGHGKIRWGETVFLPQERAQEFERFLLKEGDIVLTLDRPFIVTGTKVARVAATDVPSLLLQRVGRFIETAPGLSDDYLFLWINSPHFNDQIDPGRSNGVPHISSKQVEAAEIFVPPLAEQHRVVAKVDELMALCDRLEASLAAGSEARRRLLEALLHEALAPTEAREEAA